MTTYITVVPAYGRDYTSQAEVKADWNANKDFQICDRSSRYDGKPINRPQAEADNLIVSVRYANQRKVVVLR